jgi:hypothetical protein
MLTSLTLSPLFPLFVKFWSKLVAVLTAECVSLIPADEGIVKVAVYGEVDLTMDCTMPQLVRIAMKTIRV